jgi:hypothetical protein
MSPRVILDLCAGSGAYVDAGCDVRRIDLPTDVRLLAFPGPVHGILAAPPCTVFANSGARWTRTDEQLREALSVVDACLRLVAICRPVWWALENPVGKLSRYLGPPQFSFEPNEYGDQYTTLTLLWGRFAPLLRTLVEAPVAASEGSKMWALPPSPDRQSLRSVTPRGFAQAFFEANP